MRTVSSFKCFRLTNNTTNDTTSNTTQTPLAIVKCPNDDAALNKAKTAPVREKASLILSAVACTRVETFGARITIRKISSIAITLAARISQITSKIIFNVVFSWWYLRRMKMEKSKIIPTRQNIPK